jgi:aminoglycoside phosphotransferase family enzyme
VLARTDSLPEISTAEKVAFLSSPAAYPECDRVDRRETHMSWVFFSDDTVLKLKKPVRFPYLDFSTLDRRRKACQAEFALNRRLAPGVYEGVVPLMRRDGVLSLSGEGEPVDWLVKMRRLDERRSLEARLHAHGVPEPELDALAEVLAAFYRTARRRPREPSFHLRAWRAAVEENARVLLDPRLAMPAGRVRAVLDTQRRFLRTRPGAITARAARVVDAHGDLRPEHIWLGEPVLVIDRLEFSADLRAVDPLDELAGLEVETERLGWPEVGARISSRVRQALHDPSPEALRLFYRSYRALLRARLSIAHLLEPRPRTPQKWPRQAREYLAIAEADARRLMARLRSSPDR